MKIVVDADVLAQLNTLRGMLSKAPKRAHADDLEEAQGFLDDLVEQVEELSEKLTEAQDHLVELIDHYATWSDETEDRDVRRDARDEIEQNSADLDSLLEELDAQMVEDMGLANG